LGYNNKSTEVVVLSETAAIIAYTDGDDSNNLHAMGINIDATASPPTLTLGDQRKITTSAGDGDYLRDSGKISDTEAIFVFVRGTSSPHHVRAIVVTYSGGSLSWGNDYLVIDSDWDDYPSCAVKSAGEIVVEHFSDLWLLSWDSGAATLSEEWSDSASANLRGGRLRYLVDDNFLFVGNSVSAILRMDDNAEEFVEETTYSMPTNIGVCTSLLQMDKSSSTFHFVAAHDGSGWLDPEYLGFEIWCQPFAIQKEFQLTDPFDAALGYGETRGPMFSCNLETIYAFGWVNNELPIFRLTWYKGAPSTLTFMEYNKLSAGDEGSRYCTGKINSNWAILAGRLKDAGGMFMIILPAT